MQAECNKGFTASYPCVQAITGSLSCTWLICLYEICGKVVVSEISASFWGLIKIS